MPDNAISTTGGGAVFLSYAREDAACAGKIAEALRAAGVEVWFDLSELRGGDLWDQKIRRQIKECTLFVPIVSANTQARPEGYFRREWKMAVDRTHDMSESRAFIVPVLVDQTAESAADVPEQFLKAHFSRLPDGNATPAFVAQVRRLLQAPRRQEPVPAGAPLPARRPGWSRMAVWGVMAALAAGGIFFWTNRPAAPHGGDAGVGAPPVPSPAPVISDKSIAVLPFTDMSEAKDKEYLSDGLAEELLNLLVKIPELRVTSRTSAFSFKGQKVELPEIARRLKVAHILEGSVRTSGNRLRITAQLIDARTDTHLWSETYDRDKTDLFAVQDEIAAAVVAQLKVTLLGASPHAKKADPEAYTLFLRARKLMRDDTPTSVPEAIRLYQRSLEIDPHLAASWVGLAQCYRQQASTDVITIADGARLSRAAVDRALAIDPDLAIAHATLGLVRLSAGDDLQQVASHFERALALEPANTDILAFTMMLLRNLGQLGQAVEVGRYLTAHDPLNPNSHAQLGGACIRAGRYDEAAAALHRSLQLSPTRNEIRASLADALLLSGKAQEAYDVLQHEPVASWRRVGLAMAAHALGRKAESDALLAEAAAQDATDGAWNIAYVYAYRGQTNEAFAWLETAVANLDSGTTQTAVTPQFANLHADPRWLPFLRRIGRAPEQLAAIKFEMKLPAQ